MKVVWIFGVALLALLLVSCFAGILPTFRNMRQGLTKAEVLDKLKTKPAGSGYLKYKGPRMLDQRYSLDDNYDLTIFPALLDYVRNDSVAFRMDVLIYKRQEYGMDYMPGAGGTMMMTQTARPEELYAFFFVDDSLSYWGDCDTFYKNVGVKIEEELKI